MRLLPGKPVDSTGRLLVLNALNQESQANIAVDAKTGKQVALWYDDTTPHLKAEWLPIGIKVAAENGWVVLCLVGPGQAPRTYTGENVYNGLEVYPKGLGLGILGYLREFVLPKRFRRYDFYIVQKLFTWDDKHKPLSPRSARWLLKLINQLGPFKYGPFQF